MFIIKKKTVKVGEKTNNIFNINVLERRQTTSRTPSLNNKYFLKILLTSK